MRIFYTPPRPTADAPSPVPAPAAAIVSDQDFETVKEAIIQIHESLKGVRRDMENGLAQCRDELKQDTDAAVRSIRETLDLVEQQLAVRPSVAAPVPAAPADGKRFEDLSTGVQREFQQAKDQLQAVVDAWTGKMKEQETALETVRRDMEALTDALQTLQASQAPTEKILSEALDSIPGAVDIPSASTILPPDVPPTPGLLRRFWTYLNQPAVGLPKAH